MPLEKYARLDVLVFMHNIARRFKLIKAIRNEKIVYHASSTPVYGLPVPLKPRKKNLSTVFNHFIILE